MSGLGGGGGGGGGLFSDPLELALMAGTAIAAPYAAPLLFEGGALAGSTMLGAGVAGAGIGGLANTLTGRNTTQGMLMGGLGGAGASYLGVGAGAGTAPTVLGSIEEPLAAGLTTSLPVSSLGLTGTQAAMGLGGIGLMGAMQADKNKYGVPSNSAVNWNGGNLSNFRYDPRSYNPDVVKPPAPPYQAQYQMRRTTPDQQAAPGGLEAPYQPVYAAGGGLMQEDNMNFATGGMYPMSQQDHTQFATSPQMPASMQTTMAGYDPQTNPLTGEPTKMMAGGGMPKFSIGGSYSASATNNGPITGSDGSMIGDLVIQALGPQGAAALQQSGTPNSVMNLVLDKKTGNYVMPQGMASGGIASLGSYSDGGQMLKGPGDGMSDSIPARIGKAQPARLADNEFVVPADVVSHLGNGSSDAGAKKLYAMMNNVRKARTGKKRQAPKINADKYLPA